MPEPITKNNEQVVVAVSRTVKAGCEAEYEAWVSKIAGLAARFQGYMGANIFRPSAGSREYTTIYRFDTHAHAAAWQTSPEHAQTVAEVAYLIEGQENRNMLSGLEVWFDQKNTVSPAPQPSRWKMSLVLFSVVFVLLNTLLTVLNPLLSNWPRLAQTALVVGIQVILMTYLIMPRVNRLLAKWLFK